MTIHYTDQRHRGTTGATETPEPRRKFAKPRRNLSYDAHREREWKSLNATFEQFDASCAEVKPLRRSLLEILDQYCPLWSPA